MRLPLNDIATLGEVSTRGAVSQLCAKYHSKTPADFAHRIPARDCPPRPHIEGAQAPCSLPFLRELLVDRAENAKKGRFPFAVWLRSCADFAAGSMVGLSDDRNEFVEPLVAWASSPPSVVLQ